MVVGTSGSGKTTLAHQLADQFHIKHIELDALHWQANWTATPPDELRARVAQAVADEGWVSDGNYGSLRDLVWARADTLIWLDYPLWIVLWRVIRRTAWRVLTRKTLWNGNRESLNAAFGRDSIILWALQTHQRNRHIYSRLITQPEYAHLHCIRLSSPRATRRWLNLVHFS